MCQFNTLLRKLILAGVVAAAASLSSQAHAGGNVPFGGSNGFSGKNFNGNHFSFNGKGFNGNGFPGNGFNGNNFNVKNFSGNGFNNGFNSFKGNNFNNGIHFPSNFSGHKFGFPTNGHFQGPVFIPHKNHFHVGSNPFHF